MFPTSEFTAHYFWALIIQGKTSRFREPEKSVQIINLTCTYDGLKWQNTFKFRIAAVLCVEY